MKMFFGLFLISWGKNAVGNRTKKANEAKDESGK